MLRGRVRDERGSVVMMVLVVLVGVTILGAAGLAITTDDIRQSENLEASTEAFYAAEDMDYKTAFEYMNEAFPRLCSTKDAAEGIRAFMEKRTPEWKEQ